MLIPFGSVDPLTGPAAIEKAKRLVGDFGVRGFKFHPSVCRASTPATGLLPAVRGTGRVGLPVVFHTGQTGIGAGTRGGFGIKLGYSNPILLDAVAADFPELTIIMAHPSVPWQDEAIAVATHKANVYIDLSGWSPEVLPAATGPAGQLAAAGQGAVRLRLPADHPRTLAGRLRRPRPEGPGPAEDPQGQRRPRARNSRPRDRFLTCRPSSRDRRCQTPFDERDTQHPSRRRARPTDAAADAPRPSH